VRSALHETGKGTSFTRANNDASRLRLQPLWFSCWPRKTPAKENRSGWKPRVCADAVGTSGTRALPDWGRLFRRGFGAAGM